MEKSIGLPKSIGYTNRQHCLNFLYAFEAGDINDMLNLCDDQAFVHFVPLGKSFSGHVHSLGRIFWNAFLESFSDLRIIIHNTTWLEEDTNTVTLLISLQARHTYSFADIHCEGHELNCKHLIIFQLNKKNRISNIEVSWNHREMKSQLGDDY